MKNQKHIEAYQELFDYMSDEYGLTLLQSNWITVPESMIDDYEKYLKYVGGKENNKGKYNDSKA